MSEPKKENEDKPKQDSKKEIAELIKKVAERNGKELKNEAKDARDEKIKDLTSTLQRLQAEFENYKKRVDKENALFKEYVAAEFAKKVLPVLDSFESALKNSADAEKFRKGVELIYCQLFSSLEEMGLRKIDCVSKKFDPYKHEVLMVDDCPEHKDEIIMEEFQKGYMFKDNVLRHSKVKVAKNSNQESKKE